MKQSRRRRVVIIGAGPGGVSAALALLQQGYEVQLFERRPEPQPLGGAVLLSVPSLAVLRYYGIGLENFGSKAWVEFHNNKGHVRARLPFNPKVEQVFGIEGWHYGVLRKSAFGKMLEKVPEGAIQGDRRFTHYTEDGDTVTAHFEKGEPVECDVLIGADGIRSKVSEQAFGDPKLFHVGLRVWLAWCDTVDDLPVDRGVIAHSRRYQASYLPMLHDGKQGFEWWVVEARKENAPEPADPGAYLRKIVEDFAGPLPRLIEATDFETQVFPWDVYNRPSLEHYTKGRIACIGDAVHPVSPYAAYGMGMAIEDGYYLAKFLGGRDLSSDIVAEAFSFYEAERLDYANHQVEFARKLGNIFHKMPAPLAALRDVVYDNTKILGRQISKDYLSEQEAMCLSLTELHRDQRLMSRGKGICGVMHQ